MRYQDDFFRAVNGEWLKNTKIPADKPRYGSFDKLNEDTLLTVKKLLLNKKNAEKMPRAVALFNSHFQNEGTSKKDKLALDEKLKQIHKQKNINVFLEFVAKNYSEYSNLAPFAVFAAPDVENPDYNILQFTQTGITLDEEHYRENKHFELLKAYQTHLEKVFSILGSSLGIENPREKAELVVEFEKKVAKLHLKNEELRDVNLTHNPMTLGDLNRVSKKFDLIKTLQNFEKGAKVDVDNVRFYKEYGKLLNEKNFEAIKLRAIYLVAKSYAVCVKKLDDEFFEFSKSLTGVKNRPQKWKRSLAFASAVGDEIAQVYVSSNFSPEATLKMNILVAFLIEAYRQSIQKVSWMSEKTKTKAIEKLSKFEPQIGFPKKYRKYEGLVVGNSLFDNITALKRFGVKQLAKKAYHEVDKQLWHMTPQTVNAYYSPVENTIVFPAAILKEPFFSNERSDAKNYGAIGAVIGHEIGHGFDDQGSEFTGEGKQENWWTNQDRAAFKKLTSQLADQYSKFIPAQLRNEKEQYFVNGNLTTGENVGDLSGLKIALFAYALSRGFRTIDELIKNDKKAVKEFFISFATVWRGVSRDEYLKLTLTVDPHSPAEFRANVVRNLDAFHKVFETKRGDGMWLSPKDRVDIW